MGKLDHDEVGGEYARQVGMHTAGVQHSALHAHHSTHQPATQNMYRPLPFSVSGHTPKQHFFPINTYKHFCAYIESILSQCTHPNVSLHKMFILLFGGHKIICKVQINQFAWVFQLYITDCYHSLFAWGVQLYITDCYHSLFVCGVQLYIIQVIIILFLNVCLLFLFVLFSRWSSPEIIWHRSDPQMRRCE